MHLHDFVNLRIRSWNFFASTQHSEEEGATNQLFSDYITEQINNSPIRNEDQTVRLISENRPMRTIPISDSQVRARTRISKLLLFFHNRTIFAVIRRRRNIDDSSSLNNGDYITTHFHYVTLPSLPEGLLDNDDNEITVPEGTDSDDSSSESEEENEIDSETEEPAPVLPKPKVENKRHPSINDITVELRLINKDSKMVATTLMSTIAQFRLHCGKEVDESTRLYFEGVLLEYNDKTLHDYGFYDKCIVQAEAEQTGQVMNIRLKHLDDTIMNIIVPNNATVGDVKRYTQFLICLY